MNNRLDITNVPVFSEKQIEKQLKKQLRFLKVIYPFLNSDDWNEGAIELRPIKRNKKDKSYIRSYNTWHLDKKDEEALGKFLQLLNGKAYCLYYSSYAFDYSKKCIKSNGENFERGKINNQNALFTTILPMDFDDISYDEFLNEKQKLLDLGIETLDIATGHGFQSLILLNYKIYDVGLLNKFTKLMISKGFKVDPSLVDAARVLRMPYSFNCKSLDEHNKHYSVSNEVMPTTDINWTEKRYDVSEVFSLIENLPTVNNKILFDYSINASNIVPLDAIENLSNNPEEIKEVKIESIESVYNSIIKFDSLPDPIKKMLTGTKAGLRNNVLLFLIPFFRNSLGLNIQTIKQILAIWGKRCLPMLEESFINSEVDRIYAYGLKTKYGAYTKELRETYGFLEFSTIKNNNKTLIPNGFFEDFDAMNDCAVKIYLTLKLAETIDNIKEFSKEDIMRYAKISERTMERNIKDLINMGYLCKRKGNKRIGEKNVFYINPYFSLSEGFTSFENSTIKLMIQNLTDGEIKLYSYLKRMVGNNDKPCWASQKYIAKKIGKGGHYVISRVTDDLHNKRFIDKNTEKKNGISHTTYFLNY